MHPLHTFTRLLQSSNAIGDRGVEMIVQGLKINNSVLRLGLVRLLFFYRFSCIFAFKIEGVNGFGGIGTYVLLYG